MPQITVVAAGIELMPENKYRKSILITNSSTTLYVYIDNITPATITVNNAGIRLAPGASVTYNSLLDGDSTIQAQWTAIASGAGPTTVFVKESESIER